MAAVPTPLHTVAASVYDWWKQRGDSEAERPYLGASVIGGPCERALWYGFRWAEVRKFDGRLYRLFERGRNEEAVVVEELRGTGCEVSDTDPHGNQWGFVALGGHFRGHMDGAVRGTPYGPKSWAVLEIKTHSAKSFKTLTDKGVQVSHPTHFAQMQIYMGQFGIDRGLYYAVCKDNDAIHTEWLHFDQDAYDKLMARASRIIGAQEPPDRISQDSSWFECKWCDYQEICHGTAAPRATCRTCAHATPELDGTTGLWSCAKDNRYSGTEAQMIGCNEHRYIPILLERFADYQGTPDGANPCYKNKLTGNTFVNGAAPGYASTEIRAAADKRALGDPGVDELRSTFDAKVAA